MRSVLSVSIPAATLRRLKKKAKDEDMTVSAYIVRLVDEEEGAITEEELLAFAKEAEEDVRTGKAKRLKSPQDLLLPKLP
jgi:predicted DNA-binding protein